MPRATRRLGAAAALPRRTARRRWAKRSLLAGCLLAAAALSPPALSSEEPTYAAYLTLVERSCHERDRAVLVLSRWSQEALEGVGQRLHECGECRAVQGAPSKPEGLVDAECGCESPPWATAAVLHTLHAFTSTPGPGSRFHVSFAARLVEQVDDETFRRQWLLAAGLGSLYRVEQETARAFLRQGLERFEDDPALLVALGASEEVQAWRLWLVVRDQGGGRPLPERERLVQKATLNLHWTNASQLYEKALARAPEHPEAHLRLGRVELLLGHTEGGLANLQWVKAHSADPGLVYLAHLFVGREQKRAGRLEAALASYRAALEVDPRGQAASVATSHALYLSGDTAAAAEVLERSLAARRRGRGRDAWSGYPTGRPDRLVDLLTRLHEEACR